MKLQSNSRRCGPGRFAADLTIDIDWTGVCRGGHQMVVD
ncbi:hypothetical protein RR11_3178 [Ruegeria sp. R11]|nr:hypothetical protein RR11_3178 [Ruegeria sp. R11]